jgi:hypothetical protein
LLADYFLADGGSIPLAKIQTKRKIPKKAEILLFDERVEGIYRVINLPSQIYSLSATAENAHPHFPAFAAKNFY